MFIQGLGSNESKQVCEHQMQKLGNILINVMQELSRTSTNGEAKIEVNSSICSPEEFETLFSYFTRGTILERIDLDVENIDPVVTCGCGFTQKAEEGHDGYTKCPECGRFAEIRDPSYNIVQPNPESVGERKSIRFS